MSNLQLLTTKNFNGIAFDCYQDKEVSNDDFWATREQIGRLLEYENLRISIANIHNRNTERLNKFSRVIKLITHEESRDVTRETTIYNFRGLLEICRYSNQPKANAVMDFLYDIADEIRKKGYYGSPINIRAAELLKDIAQYTSGEERKEIIKEAFKLATGHEMPKKEENISPVRYWTAQQIGKVLKWPLDAVLHRAKNLGITDNPNNGYWDGDIWLFNKEGRKKFLELVDRGIVKIKDGFEYYENGFKKIHWSYEV